MPDMSRTAIAVIAAGFAGTVINSIAVHLVFPDVDLVGLLAKYGRYLVAIAVAALLPIIYSQMSGTNAAILALTTLTVIPSVLAKLVFGVGAPWGWVLFLNLVYAFVAWLVYQALTRPSSES